MPTQYFIATDKQTAKTQNKIWWEKILGRPKNPEDGTEFLFAMLNDPTSNKVLIVVGQADYDKLWPLLTPQEQAFVTNNIRQANDPQVIAMKANIGDAAYAPGEPRPGNSP